MVLTIIAQTMAANLTTQVRSVALVVGAVARGDASQTVTVEAHGEMLAMKTSVNETVRRLSALRDEVVDRLAFPMVGPAGKHANVADRQQDAWTVRVLRIRPACFLCPDRCGWIRSVGQTCHAK